jgi:hypothetical protein
LQKGSAVLSTAQRKKRRRILAWLALIPGVAVGGREKNRP